MKNKVPLKLRRLVKTMPVGLLPLVVLMLLVLQFSMPPLVLPQQQTSPPHLAKKILVLYTYGGGLPAYQKASAAFLSVMTERGVNTDDIFLEYLDLQRNNDGAYRRRLADMLRHKYAMRQVGLIVTVHTGALEFLLEEGKRLFPDVPVFSYLTTRPELIEAKKTGRLILQRPQNLDMRGTLEIALKMFPETRKVIFVTGAAAADRRFEDEAKRNFGLWRDKLEIEYTSDRSLEEILELVASPPPRSIIIYSNVFSDRTGQTFTPLEVGKMVAKAAKAPVFCLWDTLIGNGPIGGSLLSFEAEGRYAANEALDLLNGKIVLTKPVTTLASGKTFMFDWRELRRWGVNESILPEGSIVINKGYTLWDLKYYIMGLLLFCLAETALIIILVIQRRWRKAAQESLRKAEAKYRSIFESAVEGIYETSVEGRSLTANPAMVKMLGYASEEDLRSSIIDTANQLWVDPNERVKYVRLLEEQQVVLGFEAQILRKDRTKIWVSVNGRRVAGPDGQTLFYSSFVEDITERKEAEQAAFQSHKELLQMERLSRMGELTASLAHELNQPLTSILSNARAALRFIDSDNLDIDELKDILTDIADDDKRAGDIIRSLRSMVKPEGGEQVSASMNDLLRQVVSLFHGEAIIRNIQVETFFTDPLPMVNIDKVQIQQVVINLMMNAAESMDQVRNRKITIRTETHDGRKVRVAVSDCGPGIEEKDLGKLFEPFFTTKGSGLGMGLSLSRSIIEAHGGRIWAENNPDKGATFYFDLPGAVEAV